MRARKGVMGEPSRSSVILISLNLLCGSLLVIAGRRHLKGRTNVQDAPTTRRPRHDAAELRAAAETLWPERCAAGMAAHLGRPKATTRCWLAGRRRPPIGVLSAVCAELQRRAEVAMSVRAFLREEALRREREPRRLSGWADIRERDGPGSAPRDGRWRGGSRWVG